MQCGEGGFAGDLRDIRGCRIGAGDRAGYSDATDDGSGREPHRFHRADDCDDHTERHNDER
jgi:hypothetical protein